MSRCSRCWKRAAIAPRGRWRRLWVTAPTAPERRIAQAHEAQVELRTKMPSLRKGGRYGPADFRVSGDGKIAHCPAGAASVEVRRRGKGHLHLWSAEICGSCPLKAVCTTAARRTLAVAPDFHDRRERERYARSEDGRQRLRERMAAEHAIGRLKNLGAGTARRCGRAKTKAQWLWSAAVANLSLIWGSDVAHDGGCPHPTVALRRARAAMYALFRRHVSGFAGPRALSTAASLPDVRRNPRRRYSPRPHFAAGPLACDSLALRRVDGSRRTARRAVGSRSGTCAWCDDSLPRALYLQERAC